MDNDTAGEGRSDAVPVAVIHSNPISQAGFTMIPNVVMLDQRLSLGAKLAYGYLKHLAWRARNGTIESALVTLCRDLGVTENTMRGYLRELAAEDVGLVESKRRGLGLPNLYTVHDPRGAEDQELRDGNGESAVEDAEKVRVPTRARSLPEEEEDLDQETPSALGRRNEVPKLVKIGGRDLAFDVLASECGVDADGNRAREVAVALNGSSRSGLPQGIRAMAWIESRALGVLGGEQFETHLVHSIQARAAVYREAMGGAMLTPLALAKWWTDVGKVVPQRGQKFGRRNVTPDEFDALAERLKNEEVELEGRKELEAG